MTTPPLYGSRVAATGALLLGLGALLAIAMWRSTLGPFSFGLVAEPTPSWRVALWSAGNEAERLHSAARWRARFDDRFDLVLLTRDRLVAESRNAFDLLLLDGVALGAVEAEWLRGFVEAGGRLGLFGCGDTGNAEHAVALTAVVGEPLRAARDHRWTLLRARPGPLAAGFSADARLPLRRAHNVFALAGASGDAEVVWATASEAGSGGFDPAASEAGSGGFDPAASEAGSGVVSATAGQGAAWRRRVGAGRVVWWAVRPDVALDRSDVQATMTRMVRASTAWLLEEPFAEIDAAGDGEHHLDARVARRTNTRYLLSISNRGELPSPPFALRVHLNRRVEAVAVERTAVSLRPGGLATPNATLADSGLEMTLESGSIAAAESRSYYLDLREASDAP